MTTISLGKNNTNNIYKKFYIVIYIAYIDYTSNQHVPYANDIICAIADIRVILMFT